MKLSSFFALIIIAVSKLSFEAALAVEDGPECVFRSPSQLRNAADQTSVLVETTVDDINVHMTFSAQDADPCFGLRTSVRVFDAVCNVDWQVTGINTYEVHIDEEDLNACGAEASVSHDGEYVFYNAEVSLEFMFDGESWRKLNGLLLYSRHLTSSKVTAKFLPFDEHSRNEDELVKEYGANEQVNEQQSPEDICEGQNCGDRTE